MFVDHVERLLTVLGPDDFKVCLGEVIGQQLQLVWFVVSDKNANGHLASSSFTSVVRLGMPHHNYIFVTLHYSAITGSVTVKDVTPSCELVTSMAPRCRFTICLTIASPSPVPPICRDRALSTR